MAKRAKLKPARDLRSPGYTLPEDLGEMPADEKLLQLVVMHGFKKSAAAQQRLSLIIEWWRTEVAIAKDPNGSEPTGKERREFFETLIGRCEGLRDSLDKLDGLANKAIYENAKRWWGGDSLDLKQLQRQTRLLQWAATAALPDIPNSKAGPPIDAPMRYLLIELWRLYLKEFGEDARRITQAGNVFSGKFFDFASDVLSLLHINKTNYALGKAIRAAQQYVKRHPRQQELCP